MHAHAGSVRKLVRRFGLAHGHTNTYTRTTHTHTHTHTRTHTHTHTYRTHEAAPRLCGAGKLCSQHPPTFPTRALSCPLSTRNASARTRCWLSPTCMRPSPLYRASHTRRFFSSHHAWVEGCACWTMPMHAHAQAPADAYSTMLTTNPARHA
jgi:hypothetical protein